MSACAVRVSVLRRARISTIDQSIASRAVAAAVAAAIVLTIYVVIGVDVDHVLPQNKAVKHFKSLNKLKTIVWGDSGKRVRSRPDLRNGILSVEDQVSRCSAGMFPVARHHLAALSCGDMDFVFMYNRQKQSLLLEPEPIIP